MMNFIIKTDTDQIESINPELSFDAKIMWLGLLFVLKFVRKPLRNNP